MDMGVGIIIRIDTDKIKNWEDIQEMHWSYIEENVLITLRKYNFISFLFSDKKKHNEEETEDKYKHIIRRCKIYEGVVKFTINSKYNANIYPVVDIFYNKEKDINKLKKTHPETGKNKKFYEHLHKAIDEVGSCKTYKNKNLILKKIGLDGYVNFINIRKDIKEILDYDISNQSNKEELENSINKICNETEVYKEVISILTGKEFVNEKELVENINKLVLGKKSDWGKFICNYEKKSDINIKIFNVINEFYKNNSYAENIIKNVGEKFEIDSDIKRVLDNLKKGINNYEKKKSLTNEEKKEILKDCGYIKYSKRYDTVDIIKKLFDYDAFSKNNSGWDRHKFLTMLGIEVCPYCNRQYITSYSEGDDSTEKKTTADLDHYYPQSEYPFLALSLYNFIPSCQICNSRFKGYKTEKTMYPYEESFDDEDVQYKFETSIKGDIRYLIGEDKDFTLSINKGKSEKNDDKLDRADNSNKIFKLDKVYQSHKGYVKELYEKAYKYNEVWCDDVNEIFKKVLFIDKKELFEFAFGKYLTPEEYNKRPLAKLTRDILDELRIEVE